MIYPNRWLDGGRITASRILSYLLFALLGYAAWAQGGVYPPWQWPMITLSFLLLGGVAFFNPEQRQALRKAVWRDPVTYLGLALLVLLLIQGMNSGYLVVWDTVEKVGMVRQPSPWLPWSVEPETAAEMLRWFFPAWTAILVVRHVLDRDDIKWLLYLLVWNAALLAGVGIVQDMAQSPKMLGLWTIPGNVFFSTFAYINHGAAWFYLHAALAAGLAHDALLKRKPPVQTAVWCSCFFLCILAAFASLSRAGAVGAIVLLVGVLAVSIRWTWKKSKGNGALNATGLVCIVVLAGVGLYLGAGDGALAQEIADSMWGDKMEATLAGRTIQLPGAWEIVKEYPLFGCGGWGYRWMVLLHIPIAEWSEWQVSGRANVHCDPLQFLVELGGFGVVCMVAAVSFLIRSALQAGKPDALRGWIGVGLLLVFLHGWVDLPFRSPAILLAWCTLLAALGRLTRTKQAL